MQNPLFAQLGQKVLENPRGRSRDPKSPKASRPWGKVPWFPNTLRPSQMLGIQWGAVRDGHSTVFKGFPTPTPLPAPTPEVLLDCSQLAHPLGWVGGTILSCLPWAARRQQGSELRPLAHLHENTARPGELDWGGTGFPLGLVVLAHVCARIWSSTVPWNLLPWRQGGLSTLPSKAAGTSTVVVPKTRLV